LLFLPGARNGAAVSTQSGGSGRPRTPQISLWRSLESGGGPLQAKGTGFWNHENIMNRSREPPPTTVPRAQNCSRGSIFPETTHGAKARKNPNERLRGECWANSQPAGKNISLGPFHQKKQGKPTQRLSQRIGLTNHTHINIRDENLHQNSTTKNSERNSRKGYQEKVQKLMAKRIRKA